MTQTLNRSQFLDELAEKARKSVLSYSNLTMRNFQAAQHHRLICQFLNKVDRGEIKRLIISMPPRHGKTELTSQRFPAFLLGRNPNRQIIGTSYSSSLASRVSRNIQKIIESEAHQIAFPDVKLGRMNDKILDLKSKRTSSEFEIVGHGGAYRAAGIGGGITGSGADILLIDDPFKNRKEAESVVLREAIYDWYTSTAYSRLEKDGAIIIVMTRWHEDDLAGRLLREAKEDPEKDQWVELKLEAICETKFQYDWREQGEALWPEKYPIERLKSMKKTMGSYDWNSLYQQSPKPADGGIIKRHWWKFYKALPQEAMVIAQFWDCAQKPGITNDYSVCATWGWTQTGIYLLDLWRNKVEAPDLEVAARSNYNKWNPSAVVIEDKSAGSSLIQSLRRSTTMPILAFEPRGDKAVRAIAATPMIESGNCHLPINAQYLEDFLDEHERFPNAAHDDIVDTTSMMVEYFSQFTNNLPRIISL